MLYWEDVVDSLYKGSAGDSCAIKTYLKERATHDKRYFVFTQPKLSYETPFRGSCHAEMVLMALHAASIVCMTPAVLC
jgi:hypothetical protein